MRPVFHSYAECALGSRPADGCNACAYGDTDCAPYPCGGGLYLAPESPHFNATVALQDMRKRLQGAKEALGK